MDRVPGQERLRDTELPRCSGAAAIVSQHLLINKEEKSSDPGRNASTT